MAADSSSEETPSETVAALFPIFLVAVLSCFLFPITLYRIGRRFGLFSSFLSGEDGESSKGGEISLLNINKKNKKSEGTTSSAEQKQKQQQNIQIKAKDGSLWAKSFEQSVRQSKQSMKRQMFFSGWNLAIVCGWILFFLLLFWAKAMQMEEKRFDPYEILELSIGATPSEIKRAYRKMSLKYHPDKNSDPEAIKFFTESVAPAYKTLTNDIARENFEKYGHPDGRQSTKLGVALPEELFGRGRFEGLAPFVLLGMVLVTILLPLIVIVRILMKGDKYAHTGVDGKKVLRQTQSNFGQMLKPMIKLTEVPQLVSVAQEFMEMEYKGEKLNESLSEVLKQCRNEIGGGELAQKFVRRHPNVVRTHALQLMHLLRKGEEVPRELMKDFDFVVKNVPRFIDQILLMLLQTSGNPRAGFTAVKPTQAVLEYSQLFTQAVPITLKKSSSSTNASSGRVGSIANSDDGGAAGLLQLPHFTEKECAKIRKKAKSLAELREMAKEERAAVLEKFAEFDENKRADVETIMNIVPKVVKFECEIFVEGESPSSSSASGVQAGNDGVVAGGIKQQQQQKQPLILEDDIITARASVQISRGGGPIGDADLPPVPFGRGIKKPESWYLLVCDPLANLTLAMKKLSKAEKLAAETGDEPTKIAVKFMAPPAALYSVTFALVSDYWIGVDRKQNAKFKVSKRTPEAEKERDSTSGNKKKKGAAPSKSKGASLPPAATAAATSEAATAGEGDTSKKEQSGKKEEGIVASEDEIDSEDDEESDDDDGHHDPNYPSDETGTEESDNEKLEPYVLKQQQQQQQKEERPKQERPVMSASAATPEKKEKGAATSKDVGEEEDKEDGEAKEEEVVAEN